MEETIRSRAAGDCYTCAESLLLAAGEAWGLAVTPAMVRLMSGFGGGMGDGCTCGAVCAGIALLGLRFSSGNGNESPRLMVKSKQFMSRCRQELGSLDCEKLAGECLAEGTASVCRHVCRVARLLQEVAEAPCGAPETGPNIMRMSPEEMAAKMEEYFGL